MIETIGVVSVGILSLIGVIIQKNGNTKIEHINYQIEQLRKESKDNDDKLNDKIDDNKIGELKRWLITEMSKIEQGVFVPSENEKRVLSEAKDEYNKAGGDSYVDDMYDNLKKKGLI